MGLNLNFVLFGVPAPTSTVIGVAATATGGCATTTGLVLEGTAAAVYACTRAYLHHEGGNAIRDAHFPPSIYGLHGVSKKTTV
jgi:hypothetical protein